MQDYSNIFIVSGPSGAGEDSIIDGLAKVMPIERIVTTTTREPRPGESQGSPYYFVTREEFEAALAQGMFVEHAEQYNGQLYGVSRQELDRVAQTGRIGIWKIEYKGVMTVKELFPEIQAVFITVPSLDVLEERIRRRDNVSEDYIRERMAYTREWMKHQDIYDFTVVNGNGRLDEAVQAVAAFIRERKKM